VRADAGETAASYPKDIMGDLRFRTDNIPIRSIAVENPNSNSNNRSSFSPSFSFAGGEDYSPFEGAGAISTWRIDLPPDLRPFDYQTISDAVFHLRYTSRQGGAPFCAAVREATFAAIDAEATSSQGRKGPLALLVNAASDFSAGWGAFRAALADGRDARLDMVGVDNMLPFWTQRLRASVHGITMVVVPAASGRGGADVVSKLAIAEFPTLSWEDTGDNSLGKDALVLEASFSDSGNNNRRRLEPDWHITLPAVDGKTISVDNLCFVVRYAVNRVTK
jgi:hypothetical protein